MTHITIGQVGARARSLGMIFSRNPETFLYRLRYRDPALSDADGRSEWRTQDLEEIVAILDALAPAQPPPTVTIPRMVNFSNQRACSDLGERDKRSASDY
ncbi:hypothetical protein MARCHEWKA_02660 [Brevundimonas phage vB_BpoS-Marchewka]|uniref:Uncharacterized protein n=1 Tax=Brevundimonas phage vB_BpoS-Marchewka TaxID=2948604 RepID=A0A9E7N2W8_9CAUD|nr:hypothetical protein MARCHEWKA_02660 [Brevundimonas phage vB_BpoS-Marchewka]